MTRNERENQEPKIIREWTTEEINPQEIAEALRGTLKKTTDNDSRWEIDFNYGEPNPLLTLTCDPDNRTMFLHGNAPPEGVDKAYRFGVNLSNIEDLHFIQYSYPAFNRIETDMAINVRDSGSGLITAGMIVSSIAHKSRF